MDFIWGSPLLASVLIVCLSYYLLVPRISNKKDPTRKSPPRAAGAWPLIGHINLLSGPEQPHITLSNLADKYGPIFGIRLGVHPALVVSSWEIAKECFTTNDIVFSNRPRTAAIHLMGYNLAMFGFNIYGSYWRELRKISMIKLLSNHKVSALGNGMEIEIREMMKSICKSCEIQGPVEMKEIFGDLTLNLMVRTIAGSIERKMDSNERVKWREAIREFFKMMGALAVSDLLPYLKWLDYFGGTREAMKKTGREMDALLQVWLEEHKNHKGKPVEKDFMDEMIAVEDSIVQEFRRYDADTITKATCQTMMIGGTDTMTVTLTWAICLLLNNRHTLERAQEELDTKIGRDRQVKLSDIEELVYIKAIINETLRLYPPATLMPPRESSEDCVVSGYHVPAGTRLFVNLWRLQRDPSVWSDPLEFNPERFLEKNKEIDCKGQHFELLPFGGGRRICPAVTFSLQFMEFTMATFLHGFDIKNSTCEAIDMTGSLGATNTKATPLEVVLVPRLSPKIYAIFDME